MIKHLLTVLLLCTPLLVSHAQTIEGVYPKAVQSTRERLISTQTLTLNQVLVPQFQLETNSFQDDFKSVDFKNVFDIVRFDNPELNFFPDARSVFAGDINGDGKDDMISEYSNRNIADERTEDLSDLTFKTLIYYGGNTTGEHDQVVYSSLTPIGDLNGDGFDDAVGSYRGGERYYFFGSGDGYIKSDTSPIGSYLPNISGFRDFNNDGYEDALSHGGKTTNSSIFKIVFGGPNEEDFIEMDYSNRFWGRFVASKLDKDVITVFTENSFNSLSLTVFEINPEDLSLNEISNLEIPAIPNSTLSTRQQFRTIDINGDGLEEIYIPGISTREESNLTVILNTSEQGYTNGEVLETNSTESLWYPVGDIDNDDRTDFARSTEQELQIGYGPVDFSEGIPTDVTLNFEELVPDYNFPAARESTRNFGLGDFNGDGVDDFNITLESDSLFGNRIYFGSNQRELTTSLDFFYRKSDFSFISSLIESTNLGDINNDGFEDFALLFRDRTEVFFGGNFKIDPDISIPTTGIGNNSIEAGDFNGDGHKDMMVVTYYQAENSDNELVIKNKVDFFFGGNNFEDGLGHTIFEENLDPDGLKTGGLDVTNIGDFNHDGKDDFIAAFYGTTYQQLFYGNDNISDRADLIIDSFSSNFGIEGLSTQPFSFGYKVEGIGDINGDGIDDFAIADINRSLNIQGTGETNNGAVFIFYGSEHNFGNVENPIPNGIIILNEVVFKDYRYFGFHLAGGDFNGDGHGDLMIGSFSFPETTSGSDSEGEDAVFIYHGGPSFDTTSDQSFKIPSNSLENPDFIPATRLSGEIRRLNDINGDGADEIVFSSTFSEQLIGVTNPMVIMGGEAIKEDNLPAIVLNQPDSKSGMGPSGSFVNTEFGFAIGDFDGDGIPEVILQSRSQLKYRNNPIYTFPLENPDKESQTLDFTIAEEVIFTPEPIMLEATATSTLPVAFSIISGPAIVNEGALVLTGSGEVIIEASQQGNEEFNRAPLVRRFITILKADQLIEFNDITDKTFGDDPFEVIASSDSGLDVVLTIKSGPATIDGSLVTLTGAGDVILEANQAGNDNYNAAPLETLSFEVSKADQFITIDVVSNKTFGDEPFMITASAESGLPVILSILSGPGTIDDNLVTITGVGEIFIEANQVGNDNYNAAVQSISVVVIKADQDISIEAIDSKTFGDDPFTVSGSADSGLPVTFSVISGPGTISDNTITITGAGDIVIEAQQAGNENYNTSVRNITVSVFKADQEISTESIEGKTFGDDPFAVNATSDSGLPVALSIVSGPGSIEGNLVTITGTGEITIEAIQEGNENYISSNKFVSVEVSKADQEISIESIENKNFGDAPFTVTASADTGLPLTFSITSGPGTITDNEVTITGVGEIFIMVAQLGNDNYNAATQSISVIVAKADQDITFEALVDQTIEDEAFALSASASSGLPVNYTVTSGPATINGNMVSLNGTPGTVEITASQPGDDNYNSASEVIQTFEVSLVTSIDMEEVERDITIFPNPFQNDLTIEFKNMATHKFNLITVLSANGSVIQSRNISQNSSGKVSMSLSGLKAGLYFVRINAEKGVFLRKILKAE